MTLSRACRLVLVLVAVSLPVGFLAGRPRVPHPRSPAGPQQAGGVSNADCAVCHEETVKLFERNPHAVLEKSSRFRLENSCESCHGPGRAHVDEGGDKSRIVTFREGAARTAYDGRCLTCHGKDRALSGYEAGRHAGQGLACVECHNIHNSAVTTRLLKQASNDLCFDCHTREKSDFARPYHHRVPENAMRCTDCHQPHGGLDRGARRASIGSEESCFRCHREKQGPFVFEHAGLVIRDCGACHQPHGSNNPKMLLRSTVRQLCLECHSASRNVLTSQPPSFHDLRSPRYQNCTTCHVAIHGSNSSPRFLR